MLWNVAWQNLWQRRVRSVLTIAGVAVVAQLYMTMAGSLAVYERDLQQQLSGLAGRVYVQRPLVASQESDLGFPAPSSSIPAATAARLLALDGVDRAASSAALFVVLAPPDMPDGPPALLAVGIEPGHESAFLGDLPAADGQRTLPADGSVILGHAAARRLGLKPLHAGQSVEIQDRRFSVAGVLESKAWLYDAAVLLPLGAAQKLFDRSHNVSAVILTASRVEDVPALQARVTARAPKLRASSSDEIIHTANEIVNAERTFFHGINIMIVSAIVILVAIVMAVAVMEQRRELGTLRAIGARRRTIAGLVALQALALTLAGALLAWPLWAAVYLALMQTMLVPLETGFAAWLQVLALAVLVAVLAALLPAWQAARVDPIQTLRWE